MTLKKENISKGLRKGIPFYCMVVLLCFSYWLGMHKGSYTKDTIVDAEKKPGRRVYTVLVCDLFHWGHVEFLRKAKALGDYLIVGVCDDDCCYHYKRETIMTAEERMKVLRGCRYVDEVFTVPAVTVTDEIIDNNHVDIVVHGDDFDSEKLDKYFSAPLRRGIYRSVPYTRGISTTGIIKTIRNRQDLSVYDEPPKTKKMDLALSQPCDFRRFYAE